MIARTTVDPAEIQQFSAKAKEWWDPKGKFATLHKFNPVRLAYIRERACDHFGRDENAARPLDGLSILDIGCGGGLLAEPLSRLGGTVTGIDPAERNVKTAQVHAEEQGLAIDYRVAAAEDLAAEEMRFDIVLNMEVVEHVADLDLFIESAASLVKPGGLTFVATLNRTLKAFALAIVGAEYVLGWLPRGTHSWDKFVTPSELEAALVANGLVITDRSGVVYRPLADVWARSKDMDVNYMVLATRPSPG